MATLPDWIDDRVERDLDKKLDQRHVVETMVAAERPFFSTEQLRARVRPDVSDETVRNRLNELRAIDVVAAETYPDALTLYYVNWPESNWPLSPEGQRALATETPLDALSLSDFLRLRDPAGIRTLVLAGFQLTLLLFALGLLAGFLGAEAPVQATHGLVAAAGNLFAVAVALLLAERAARALRRRGAWERLAPSRRTDANGPD